MLRPLPMNSGGGGSVNSITSDQFDVFTVGFPSSGPLGITFEWALDSTTPWSARPSQTADCANNTTTTATANAPWHRASTERTSSSPATLPGQHRTSTNVNAMPDVGGAGSDSPRALLTPTILPPISPSLVVPDPSVLPHALRIQSFPLLPGESEHRPVGRSSAAPDSGTQRPDVRTADVRQHRHVSTTADGKLGDTVARSTELSGEESSTTDEPSLTAFGQTTAWEPTTATAATTTTAAAATTAATAAAGVALDPSKAGPATARDILRIGDILVEVNGNPVAGPAARQAGIATFQDAVDVVADAATDTTPGTGAERGRLFTFKRARSPKSPPQQSTAPLLPPAVLTLKGRWVGEGSGGSENKSKQGFQPTTEAGSGNEATSGTTPRTSKPHLQAWVPQLEGLTRSSDSRGSERMVGGSSRRVSAMGSSRLMSPIGSDRSLEGFRVGGGRSRKEGNRSRARGDASVFSASSAVERLKADAR